MKDDMDPPKDKEDNPVDFSRLSHCIGEVFRKLSADVKRLGVLEKVIGKRVTAEANYARALKSVDKLEVSKEGSLATAMEALSSDFNNQFRVRSELANNLNVDVLSPIADLKDSFLRDMRLVQRKWSDARKAYQTSNIKFAQVKAKYEQFCEEYRSSKQRLIAAKNNPTINSENVVKITVRVNQCMHHYKSMSEKFGLEQTKWVEDRIEYDQTCNSILKQIQLVDQQRIEVLKDSFAKWVIFETSLTANRNYDVNGLAAALECVNTNKDQSSFVAQLLDQHASPISQPLSVNDRILVFSPSQQWRETKIVEIQKDNYLVHYIGFASK